MTRSSPWTHGPNLDPLENERALAGSDWLQGLNSATQHDAAAPIWFVREKGHVLDFLTMRL